VPQTVTQESCTKKCGVLQCCFLHKNVPYCAGISSQSRCGPKERCELQSVKCASCRCMQSCAKRNGTVATGRRRAGGPAGLACLSCAWLVLILRKSLEGCEQTSPTRNILRNTSLEDEFNVNVVCSSGSRILATAALVSWVRHNNDREKTSHQIACILPRVSIGFRRLLPDDVGMPYVNPMVFCSHGCLHICFPVG
jgi:hypothetical protein